MKKTRGEKIRVTQLVTLANKGLQPSVRPRNGSERYIIEVCMTYIALIIATVNLKKSVYATFWSYWLCKALRSPLLSSETFIQHEGETLGPHTQVKHFLLL